MTVLRQDCEWCEEGIEEASNEPPRCGFCAGLEPTNENLCLSCQRYSHVKHVLFCDDPSWPGLEQDGLIKLVGFGPASGDGEASVWLSMPKQHPVNISTSLSCIMCKVISQMLMRESNACEPGARVSLWRPFPTPQTFDRWQAQQEADEGQFVLPVLLFRSETQADPSIFLLELILQYHDQRLVGVSAWDRSTIETTPIVEWLHECTSEGGVQQRHERCAKHSVVEPHFPRGFRLIDTFARCLVSYDDLEHNPEYVALSYTWASVSNTSLNLTRDTLGAFFVPGAIIGRNLFNDIVDLCCRIGQRYLWVDKLCIIQDDPSDKQSQIQEMGAIYNFATLTIVALTEANRGLPGASVRNPRLLSNPNYITSMALWQLQPTNYVSQSAGRVLPPFLDNLVDRSIWDLRGWTCQEKRLSRRLLFVTDQHVYTYCPGLVSESRNNSISTYRNYRIRSGSSFIQAGSAFERSLGQGRHLAPFISYAYAVSDYSRRVLTLWSDKLDAFSGFGNLLGIGKLFFGLPEHFFSRSLLWSPSQPRDEADLEKHWQPTSSVFPSWGWVSTRGGVSYLLGNEVPRPQDMGTLVVFRSHPSCWKEGENLEGPLQPIDDRMYWFDETVLNEKSDDEKGNFYTSILNRHLRSSLNSWKACIHSPWEAIKHYDVSSACPAVRRLTSTVPGALVFNTTCAELRLSSRSMPDARTDMDSVQINIINAHDVVIGCIYPLMPDIETATRAYDGLDRDNLYTVIVVGASLFMHWPQALPEKKSPSYSGLHVLVTHRAESGLLTRIAVGMVRQSEWNDAGAKWETVVLG